MPAPMTPQRWQRVNDLFQSLVECAPADRGPILAVACAGDDFLRREVQSLLEAHDRASGFWSTDEAGGPDPTRPTLEPGAVLGPYRITAFIACGGMGEVYRAHDPRLEREVAIKVLWGGTIGRDPARRLEREARAAAALNHPSILAVYDVGMAGQAPYVVCELLEGATLSARLREGPFSAPRARELGLQIASGLAAAHAKGIVHRDLKPENLFLTRDDRIKILDFGLARQALPAPEANAPTLPLLTQPGVVLGTVGYMAPEQVKGQRADERSDIFSFGAVLFEMSTGTRAFAKGSAVETMNAILNDEPPGGTSAGLDRIVRRCLRKDPSDRFQSARDLVFALEAAEDTVRDSGPAAAARPPLAMAVLPFLNLTGDAEQEYFCDGMAEELIGALARIPGLRVVARSSAFRFRGQSLERIGYELGVARVLEGSVRRSGRHIRIAVQLVDTADGYHLWSERYDRNLDDVFVLQDEITARVVEAMRLKLSPPKARHRPDDLEAYHHYLKGLHFWNKRHAGVLQEAVRAFTAATERDPLFAAAHVGLAESYALLGLGIYGAEPSLEAMPKAKAEALHALAIDPSLAAPHAVLGWIRLHHEWDWPSAERDFERAIAIDPDRATSRHWYAFLLSALGRHGEARQQTERAWELDPHALIINTQLCQAHYYARRYDEVERAARKVLEMDPAFAVADFWVACAHIARRRNLEALTAVEAFVAHGGSRARGLALAGCARAQAGERPAALAALAELEALAEQRFVSAYDMALVQGALGNADAAFASLDRAYDERSDQLPYIAVEPLLDPLRSDRRFTALRQRLKLPLASSGAAGEGPPAAAFAHRKSVGVMPFRDLSSDPDGAHLGLVLADAIITELARLKSLFVRPTSAVLRYHERPAAAAEAARELGVDAIVEGTVQRSGSRLRVTMSLLSAPDGRTLWTSKIDTSIGDLFRMQDDVSSSVARALEVELGGSIIERRRVAPAASAAEHYFRGKAHLHRETLANHIAAVDAFERCREADPEFALGWAALADAYQRIAFQFQPEGDWYSRAVAMCDRALTLDPELPEGLYARGRLRWSPGGGWDHAGAMRDLAAAIAARPDLDEAVLRLAAILYHVGLIDEGLAELGQALALSPDHAHAQYHVGLCRYHQGRIPEAFEISTSVARRAPSSWIHYQTALCQIRLGCLDDAASTIEVMERQVPGELLVHPLLGLIASQRGQEGEARERVRLTAEDRRAYGHYHHAQYDVACILARFGDTANALAWLREAAANGYPCVTFFEQDSWLAPLRAEPGFAVLLSELRLERARHAALYAELRSSKASG